MNARVALVGPNQLGGVLSVCNTVEQGLKNRGVEVQRVFVGAGRGPNWVGTLSGAVALLAVLPKAVRVFLWANVVHLNPSFSRKAVLRDAALIFLAKILHRPVVLHWHGGLPSRLDRLSKKALAFMVATAAEIIVLNEVQQKNLTKFFPEQNQKISLLANGVELPTINLEANIKARMIAPRLLFLSRMDKGKGILDVLRVIALLRDVGLPLPLEVAGDGVEMGVAQELCKELGLQSQVQFLGYVLGAAKTKLLNESSILLFPSSCPEGMPVTVLEALAFGMPVVAYDTEHFKGLLNQAKDGFVVSPKDLVAFTEAIRKIIGNYPVFAKSARKSAESRFDADLMLSRLLEMYGRILLYPVVKMVGT